jgi:FkbM family methyltransferase
MITEKEIEVLNYVLKGRMTIFDIGCSYGEYSLYIIDKMFGEQFKLHCFEPEGDFFAIECEEMGNYKNITLNNFALTDKEGIRDFYRIKSPSRDREGCSSFTNRPVFKDWNCIRGTVNCSTLDNYINDNNISHIDLMKIDVEGAELSVLKGGSKSLNANIVDIIQIEYGTTYTDAGITMSEIINYMSPFNYILCDFNNGFIKMDMFIEDYHFDNYYFIRKALL